MLSTTTNFKATHDLLSKKPVYMIDFDGETVKFTSSTVVLSTSGYFGWEDTSDTLWKSTDDTVWCGWKFTGIKRYLDKISGFGQTISPEEGKSTIGNIVATITDSLGEVTALIATDTTSYFHRRKTVVKAGYNGVAEADMATIMTAGRVTGMKRSSDGTAWIFDITDPKKYEQERIFREAEDTNVIIQGNPLDILLSVWMSSDTPGVTHAFYDRYGDGNGLALTTDDVDVDDVEAVRDDYFPGNSHYMKFTITEKETAMDFIQTQILKVLGLIPHVSAAGKMTVKPFKPPLVTSASVQSFDESNIDGLPKFDLNLSAMVNRVEFHRNYDGSDYQHQYDHVHAESLAARGPGKKPISIKSRGLHDDLSPGSLNSYAADVETKRVAAIFERFATPPPKIDLDTFFTRWLSEGGDIVPLTHTKLPNIIAGTMGISETRMEVIDRQVKWDKGRCSISLLDTGFDKGTFGVIQPDMVVTVGTDSETFTVSTTDATAFSTLTLPEVQVYDSKMRAKDSHATLLTVNTTTGVCTCDDLGFTPSVGDIVAFADYDYATDKQKLWGYISESDELIGTDDDPAHLIVP